MRADVGVAVSNSTTSSQHTPPRLKPPLHGSNFSKHEEKVADRPLHPSPRLELFSRFVRCPKGNITFATQFRASRRTRAIVEKKINKVALVVFAFFACVSRYLCTFTFLICKDDVFAESVLQCCTSLLPKTNMLPRRCSNCFVSFTGSVEPFVDAALEKVQALATRHCAVAGAVVA
jgi:hypothetical protein